MMSYLTILRVIITAPANEVWGKVMFSQVFVCPRGGVCGEGCGKHLPGPRARLSPPVETATEAGGTHPTGMYSCFWKVLVYFFFTIV